MQPRRRRRELTVPRFHVRDETLTLAWVLLAYAVGLPHAGAQTIDPMERGRQELAGKQFNKAEANFRQVIERGPATPNLYLYLGLALQGEGRSSAAVAAFERSSRTGGPEIAQALAAEERCKLGDLDRARPTLAKILAGRPPKLPLVEAVAPCTLQLDQPVAAVRAYDLLADDAQYPRDAALIGLAKAYLHSAQIFFVKLQQSGQGRAYVEAIRRARDDNSTDAREAFEAASASSPWFAADLSYSAASERWEAHPHDAALLYQMTVLSGEESIKVVRRIAAEVPDSVYLQQMHADILADQHQEDAAIQLYKDLIQANPEQLDLRYSLGMLYGKQQRWEEALAVLREELRLAPDEERATARVSEALLQLGRYDEESRLLQPMVDAGQPPLWALLDLAEVNEHTGQHQRAVRFLQQAERLDPADKTVHYKLMRLYLRLGRVAEARQEQAMFEHGSKP